MKKMRFIFAVAAIGLGSIAMTSCTAEVETTEGDGTEQNDEGGNDDQDQAQGQDQGDDKPSLADSKEWVCPDNCQEGRFYFDPGNCKGCDKELIERE